MTVYLQGEKVTESDLRSHNSSRGCLSFCHSSFVLRYSELPMVWPWGQILHSDPYMADVKYL